MGGQGDALVKINAERAPWGVGLLKGRVQAGCTGNLMVFSGEITQAQQVELVKVIGKRLGRGGMITEVFIIMPIFTQSPSNTMVTPKEASEFLKTLAWRNKAAAPQNNHGFFGGDFVGNNFQGGVS